eukprot:6180444-Pleurochrysis_carterae.AAC.1
MLPQREDTTARRLLGGQDGRGTYRVFNDETKKITHEEEYAGHPILRLFTRPKEMENGVAMSLHERHTFHLAVATDGAKQGGTKDRMETEK